ncbi:MAG TPA: immunoglobulin domain-containing protein [Candidatus Dormibacteraeota bacterium]|nr:immunoglobulin domain-containing protein [Candidatus Dormibacteraeota bacterium]
MKKSLRILIPSICLTLVSFANAQNIYQFSALPAFGSHGDGSIRPTDRTWLDTGFNQRGLAFDPINTNLVLVNAQSGSGGATTVKGNIPVINWDTGVALDDGFGGDFTLNTNNIQGGFLGSYWPDSAAAAADDGVVFVLDQMRSSTVTPLMIYRYDSSTSTSPALIVYSNTVTPVERYGTSIDVRGAGTNTQILLGSYPDQGSTGSNVLFFTTSDGTNFTPAVLGTATPGGLYAHGIAFGVSNTFWAKTVGQPLLLVSFDTNANIMTPIRNFGGLLGDSDNMGPIAVDNTRKLLVGIEETGGLVSGGGSERIRLYDISNASNATPALLDVRTVPVDNDNAQAPLGYIRFAQTRVYTHIVNNGLMGYDVALAPPPSPTLTTVPPATLQTVVGRTVNMTTIGFPSVNYQWQSNNVNIPNATNTTLTLVNVQPSFAATYTCVVTNASGSTNASTILSIVSAANFYHLNLNWAAAQGSQPYVQGLNLAGTPNQRTLAYNALSNHLVVIARSLNNQSNFTVNVVDAGTGAFLYQMKTNGVQCNVAQGGVGLTSGAFSDDGSLYACNTSLNAYGITNGTPDPTAPFRLYRWADDGTNTLPVQIYLGDPSINAGIASGVAQRWGDAMAVRGSGTNTIIILDGPNTTGSSAVRYVALLTPTDSTMLNWTQQGIHMPVVGSSIGRTLEYGAGGTATAGTFWQKRNPTALQQYPFDLVQPIDPPNASVNSTAFTNTLLGLAQDFSRHIGGGVNQVTSPSQIHTLDLYEVSDYNTPLLLAQYQFPPPTGATQNTNSAGGNSISHVLVRGDKWFALDPNNGVMAFTIAAGAPTAPNYITQPKDVRAMVGGTVSFSVTVDQFASFQWRSNNVVVSGATNSTFTFNNAQVSSAGQYFVVASNAFGSRTSIVANVTVYQPQDEYSLSSIWKYAPTNGNGNVITANGGGSPFQRTIAYNALSNHVYVVNRLSPTSASNYAVIVLNANDGSFVYTLNTNGLYNAGAVGEGGVGLGGIGVADDGAIYACNIAIDACGCGPNAGGTNIPADSLFRLYRWSSEDTNFGPTQVFAGDPSGAASPLRWGDTLVVRGSGTNTEILLDTQPGGTATILKPTDAFMTNFAPHPFGNAAQGTSIGRSLQYGAGTNTMWQKHANSPLQEFAFNLGTQTSSLVTNYSNFGNTVGPVALDLSRNIAAAINFKGSLTNTPDAVDLYELSNPNLPLLVAQYSFPTNQQSNPNFIGQVLFAGSKVWALDANNGLMAFSVLGPKLSITPSGNNVIISWTTNLGSLTLQSSPSLSSQAWSTVGGASIVGNQYQVSTPAAGTSLFYRLSK